MADADDTGQVGGAAGSTPGSEQVDLPGELLTPGGPPPPVTFQRLIWWKWYRNSSA